MWWHFFLLLYRYRNKIQKIANNLSARFNRLKNWLHFHVHCLWNIKFFKLYKNRDAEHFSLDWQCLHLFVYVHLYNGCCLHELRRVILPLCSLLHLSHLNLKPLHKIQTELKWIRNATELKKRRIRKWIRNRLTKNERKSNKRGYRPLEFAICQYLKRYWKNENTHTNREYGIKCQMSNAMRSTGVFLEAHTYVTSSNKTSILHQGANPLLIFFSPSSCVVFF